MAKQSAERLRQLIDNRFPDAAMVFVDLFAMGCLLHLQGQHGAGLMLVREVRRAVEVPGCKTYLDELIAHLPGNELRFTREIEAHGEVNELFRLELERRSAIEEVVGE
jgi:hypothetical protein